jgi:hypothetical protein
MLSSSYLSWDMLVTEFIWRFQHISARWQLSDIKIQLKPARRQILEIWAQQKPNKVRRSRMTRNFLEGGYSRWRLSRNMCDGGYRKWGFNWNPSERDYRKSELKLNSVEKGTKIGTQLKLAREGYEIRAKLKPVRKDWPKIMNELKPAREGYGKSELKWNPRERVQYKLVMAVTGSVET